MILATKFYFNKMVLWMDFKNVEGGDRVRTILTVFWNLFSPSYSERIPGRYALGIINK